MRRSEKRKIEKKRSKKRLIIISIITIFLFIIGYGSYVFINVYQAADQTYEELGRDKSKLREKEVTIKEDPISILLLGVEDYSSGGLADTIILATFNPDDKKLKMLSIPRDSLVTIPGEGENKINASYAFGGKALTIDTVENYLNVPIDYYAAVNFEGFKNIIDTVGGITVNVPFDFVQNSDDRVAEKLQFHEGPMELDGRYALAYARMRKQDPRGDLGRNDRQKEVITQIIDKVISVKSITKIDDLAKDLGDNVETNMKISEGLSFIREYSDFNTKNIEQLTLEGHSEYINNISYYLPDEDSLLDVSNELRKHLELKTQEEDNT